MHNILIVDDDIEIHNLLAKILSEHSLFFCISADESKKLVSHTKYDLIILDLSLPDSDGFNHYMELKSQTLNAETPIIFLTAKDDTSHKVVGLSIGADDYITKPFDAMELKARVLLRIQKSQVKKRASGLITKKDLQLDYSKRSLTLIIDNKKNDVEITAFEFKLLYYLVQNEDLVLTRRMLLDEIWGNDVNVIDRTIDAHMSHLRQKIKPSNYTIKSIYGEGYKFSLK